jgi:hypothetical protein
MSSDGEPEATQLEEIEADLVELTSHVNAWLQDRFLSESPDSIAGLNLEDVSGLILWLQQWQTHFDSYAEAATPAATARLAEIRTEIDNSIANFTEMAAGLLNVAEE